MIVNLDPRGSFHHLIEVEQVPSFILSTEGRIISVNPAFTDLFGERFEFFTGELLSDLLVDVETETVQAEIHQVTDCNARGKLRACEFSQAARTARFVDLDLFALRGADDKALAILVRCADATRNKADLLRTQKAQRDLVEAEAEARYRMSTEAGRVALWHLCPATGETWFSDLWYIQLDYEPGAFQPSFEAFLALLHPDDKAGTLEAFQRLLDGESDYYQADFRVRAKGGDWRWLGARGSRVDRSEHGLPELVCGTQVDISRRKEIEKQLEEAADTARNHRQRLDRLADNSPAKLFEFRMDADGVIDFPYVNAGVLDLLGVEPHDVEGDASSVFRNILPEYLEPMGAAIELSRKEIAPFRFRYVVDHPTQGKVWLLANSMPSRFPDGSTVWCGSVSDISADVQREAELHEARDRALAMQSNMERQALHDALTGLPNRRYFDMWMQDRASEGGGRDGRSVTTIVRMDLDHFKYVNDTLGHAAGDAVLKNLATILSSSVRSGDFVSRVGGDEFSIVLGNNAGVEAALRAVGQIQARLATPLLFDGQTCRFGASFGIATRESDAVSDSELLAFADAALYRAKESGRNRVEVFTRDLHANIIAERRVAAEIEEALEQGAFEPYFQPQICAVKGKIAGLEVLARWRHPTKGVLAPGAFLEIAEQIRVVPLIDRMMFEKTRDIIERWAAAGFRPPKVSFNISAGRLHDEAIVDDARLLQNSGIEVAFELLESIFIERETEAFRQNLKLIKEAGISIEIDDFGSGHASIIGMMEVEPNMLKIDRRLIGNISESRQSRDLISAIISIGRALDIKITAEGVETLEQSKLLTELGCDVLQGFYFSRPIEFFDVVPLLRSMGWMRNDGGQQLSA